MKRIKLSAVSLCVFLTVIFFTSGCKKNGAAQQACIASIPATVTINTLFSFAPCNIAHGVVYSWDFGDGGTALADSGSHFYSYPGTYTIALTAITGGTANTTTQTIVVINPAGKVKSKIAVSTINNTSTADTFEYTYDQQGRLSTLTYRAQSYYMETYAYSASVITVTPDINPVYTLTLNAQGYVFSGQGFNYTYDSDGYQIRSTIGTNMSWTTIREGNSIQSTSAIYGLPLNIANLTYLPVPNFFDMGDRFKGKSLRNLFSGITSNTGSVIMSYDLDPRGVVLSQTAIASNGSTTITTYSYY